MVLTWGRFCPQRSFSNVWRHFVIMGVCYLLVLVGKGQTRDAAEHPATSRTAPNKEESSGPKCQRCQGWETPRLSIYILRCLCFLSRTICQWRSWGQTHNKSQSFFARVISKEGALSVFLDQKQERFCLCLRWHSKGKLHYFTEAWQLPGGAGPGGQANKQHFIF